MWFVPILIKLLYCTACLQIIVLFSVYYDKFKSPYIVTLIRYCLKVCGCSHIEKTDTVGLLANNLIGYFKRGPNRSDNTVQEGIFSNLCSFSKYVIVINMIFHK